MTIAECTSSFFSKGNNAVTALGKHVRSLWTIYVTGVLVITSRVPTSFVIVFSSSVCMSNFFVCLRLRIFCFSFSCSRLRFRFNLFSSGRRRQKCVAVLFPSTPGAASVSTSAFLWLSARVTEFCIRPYFGFDDLSPGESPRNCRTV